MITSFGQRALAMQKQTLPPRQRTLAQSAQPGGCSVQLREGDGKHPPVQGGRHEHQELHRRVPRRLTQGHTRRRRKGHRVEGDKGG
jgi:hypothetical protein